MPVTGAEVARFISHQYLELDRIRRISRFRSGEGHSYADSVEQCRSMKHYFEPRVMADAGSMRIFSPIDGRVSRLFDEWAGSQVQITSTQYPAVTVILFHVRLTMALAEGTAVSAGEAIGTHIGSQTMSDVAVSVNTAAGFQLVSWFDALDDAAFDAYRARGLASRSDAIISRQERDAAPLTCAGEQFAGPGSLPNWIALQ